MFYRKTVIALFITCCFFDFSEAGGFGELFDANISPDGKKLSVGSSTGLHIFNYPSMSLIQSVDFSGSGVHFIEWAPDGSSLVCAAWSDDGSQMSKPKYYIYDLTTESVIDHFENELKWIYYTFSYHEEGTGNYVKKLSDDEYPHSKKMAHPNSIAFSPDGTEISLLARDNKLVVLSYPSLEHRTTYVIPDKTLYSIGYTNSNGDLHWIGAFDGPLSYIDRVTGAVIKEVSDQTDILYVTDDNRFALTETPHYSIYNDPFVAYSFCINILDSGHKFIALNEILVNDYSNTRYTFIPNSGKFVLLTTGSAGGSQWASVSGYEYNALLDDFQRLGTSEINYGITNNESSLAQPFSPDGKDVLVLDQGKLYVVDASNLGSDQYLPYRQLLPPTSEVADCELLQNEVREGKP